MNVVCIQWNNIPYYYKKHFNWSTKRTTALVMNCFDQLSRLLITYMQKLCFQEKAHFIDVLSYSPVTLEILPKLPQYNTMNLSTLHKNKENHVVSCTEVRLWSCDVLEWLSWTIIPVGKCANAHGTGFQFDFPRTYKHQIWM